LGRDFVKRVLKDHEKLNICDKFISKNGFISVIIMRLIPLFPWDVVNYGSGMCGIRLIDYLLATLIGTIPGSFMYNLIGSSIGKPLDVKKVVIIFILAVAIAVGVFIAKRYYGLSKKSKGK
jgi:uncharacterized membrane protein YdjX (TVP38/TMEM64 family)